MNPPPKRRIPVSPEEWLIHSKSDLKLARLGLNQDVLPEQICFHAQQSVEKALKAVLLFYKIDFPFTHDIEELLDTFEAAGISIPSDLSDVGVLTPYAVETRYPGYWGEISESEVSEAISFAEKSIKWAETLIKKISKEKEKMNDVLMETNLKGIKFLRSGKVRDIYELNDYLLIIATDRVSAFDVVLPNGIPGKGRFLTQISLYWFKQMKGIIENHLFATDVKDYPEMLHKYKDILEGRSMLVKKANPLPVECIVRGYLSGSGWKEYKERGTVCGIKLPEGLVESSRLDEPIFTPSTKEEEGHDINISFDEMKKIVDVDTAERLKKVSLEVYKKARGLAEKKGIIIADTKMEFGMYEDKIILIDELLTPDSSRFWSIKNYQLGRGQDSYDKQIVRDYLLTLDWDKKSPGPKLPDEIVKKTGERYKEILGILTG